MRMIMGAVAAVLLLGAGCVVPVEDEALLETPTAQDVGVAPTQEEPEDVVQPMPVPGSTVDETRVEEEGGDDADEDADAREDDVSDVRDADDDVPTAVPPLSVSSSAFSYGAPIPKEFSCYGADVNPPLAIRNVPAGATSLAIVLDDPDAPEGTFVHWVMWNIAPGTTSIARGTTPPGAVVGETTLGDRKYFGPCPPPTTHRYYFRVHALDTTLALAPTSSKDGLQKAMAGHILAEAHTMGTYTFREE